MKFRLFILIAILQSLICEPSPAQWSYHGLAGKFIKVIRSHGDYLYAGTNEGIFRKPIHSTDTSWIPLGLQTRHVTVLLVFDDSTYIAGVQITMEGGDTISLYKSTDAGKQWFDYQNGYGDPDGRKLVSALAMLPSESMTIFAGDGAMEKSTDGGMSWRNVIGGFTPGIQFITIDPARSHIIWAGGESIGFQPLLLRSNSGGESWQIIPINIGGDNACYSIALDPVDSNAAYVGTEGRIIKTLDGGETWSVVFFPPSYEYFYGLSFSRESIVYATGSIPWPSEPQRVVFYRSTDEGASWDTVANETAKTWGVFDFIVLPSNGVDSLFFGTWDGGVYCYANTITHVNLESQYPAPEEFSLEQNIPNPFNAETSIRFKIARSAQVRIDIYDVLGRKLQTIVDDHIVPGQYTRHITLSGLSSGIYWCRMSAGEFVGTKKLVLLR